MSKTKVPCCFKTKKFSVDSDKNDNVSTLRTKISSVLKNDPSNFNLYFRNEKLSNDTKISELKFGKDENSLIQVNLLLKPFKKKIHISSDELENKMLFLKREMKYAIANSDNITSVTTAKSILNMDSKTSISEIFSNSFKCPYICSFVFDIFKQEICKSIDTQLITTFYKQCSDLKLTGHILNCISQTNEDAINSFVKQLNLDKRFFLLLEHLNFANKPSIAKKIISKIPKYKGDLVVAAPYLILFLNNLTFEDKNYFSEIFLQTRDLKRSKYKNSSEVRMLLLAISIKCDKVQDTLKHYDKLLNTSIEKPKLTKAVLSTVHQLYLISLNKETKIIDQQTIKSIFDQIPKTYEQGNFIQNLFSSSLSCAPDKDIFTTKVIDAFQFSFSDLLEFSYSYNFLIILKSDMVKQMYHNIFFTWLANGINFMKVFKMIYDSNPEFPSAINLLFLIYSASCPEISTATFSKNSNAYIHHHAYYPSQIVDSLFNLLTLFIDILPKNDIAQKLDTRNIFEFTFLFLLRPCLSLQKAALKIIKRICKYRNNDNLSELAIYNNNDNRKKRRSSVDSLQCTKDFAIYKSLTDQINDNTYSDLDESCRIIRGALSYFIKAPQFFRDEVFIIANVSGGQSLIQKIHYLKHMQKHGREQLTKDIAQKNSPQAQRDDNSPKDTEKEVKKQKNASKNSKNVGIANKSYSSPVTPNSPTTQATPFTDGKLSDDDSIEELSYSHVYLKILLDRIEKNFEIYIPFLKSRLEFTSIAFSFISFGGDSSNIRELFLHFVSQSKLIDEFEKLDIIFRFVQNEKKLEPKQNRQSDSHISIKKFHTMNTPLISNSADQLIITGKPKRSRSIINTNLDSSCYIREMDIILNIMKTLNHNLTSENYTVQKFMYFYIYLQLSTSKSLGSDFYKLIDAHFDVFSNPKCVIYEYYRFYTFSIFYNLYDKRTTYLMPQIKAKSVVDFLKHQDYDTKKFFHNIFHSFLIDNDHSLKKAVCMILSLKAHTKIDFSLSTLDILKENPKKAIRVLLAVLSSQFITNKMVERVTNYLNYFLERNYPFEAKSVSLLIGAEESVMETFFENTKDCISHFLPLFMINNVFSFNLWNKIAESYSRNKVLQCIISTFSAYSRYLAYLNSIGGYTECFEKCPENINIAYRLFEIYGVKKSKPWQVIALSLLFMERNEFALKNLEEIIDDNDRLKSIKKSPISDHFDKPIENLLNNYDDDEVDSAVLDILPFVQSQKNFDELFSYIKSKEELDTKDVLRTIDNYCYFNTCLTSDPIFLEFLISKIDDEKQLKNLTPQIRKIIKKNKSEQNIDE